MIEKTNKLIEESSLENTKESTVKTVRKAAATGNTKRSVSNPNEDPLLAAISTSYKAEKRTRQFAENDFQLNAANGSLNVIMETGGLIYECTEHVIHGKNGFEYPLRRIYDTDMARKDCPSMTELVRDLEVNIQDAAWLLDRMGCSIKGHNFPDNPSQNRGLHFNDEAGNHYDY